MLNGINGYANQSKLHSRDESENIVNNEVHIAGCNLNSCIPLDTKVVISGIAGRFPNSKNVHHFSYNLYNKIDMVDDDERRFKHTKGVSPRIGKVYDLEKFDAGYFNVKSSFASSMHPQIRCLLEHAVEAVYDSGIHPNEIAGKRVGVFSAASDFEQTNGNNFKADVYSIIGGTKSVVANLISQFLDLKGPSMTVDSACSSSMMALQCAYNAIMCGECIAAIVTGSNLILTPNAALQMTKLGMLSADGYSRVFDEKASGYVKSEAVVAIFIQKYKDARRCYAKIVHLKSGADGKKPDGPVSPYGAEQQKLVESFYDEIKMSPNVVQYVEAHATGTSVGDPQECNAILNAFCKDRSKALLIGSVKSNMGHSENSAGLSSIVKSILTFETGTIAPNIHFDRPNKKIVGLNDGRLKIVLEKTEFPGSFIALNCFGVGGANGHALLQKRDPPNFLRPSSRHFDNFLEFYSEMTSFST